MRSVCAAAMAVAVSLALSGGALAQGAPLQNGTYTCIAGYSFMLTIGEMTIDGNNYRFHPPEGPDTTGTYSYAPGRITWSGDIGVITNAQITESDMDAGGTKTDVFWFQYMLDATHGNTASCKL